MMMILIDVQQNNVLESLSLCYFYFGWVYHNGLGEITVMVATNVVLPSTICFLLEENGKWMLLHALPDIQLLLCFVACFLGPFQEVPSKKMTRHEYQ